MPLASGTRLGPYEILALIGEGGMGEVYQARDTRLERIVALKVCKTDFTERFEREARAVAALNHPNICQLYDVGPNYLVMEFIDGAALKGPIPVEKAIGYACQILDALDAAHKRRIVHRDLKPANILLTRQGIKLLDFGLAKRRPAVQSTEATLTQALTGSGQILGTLQYMSPEQLQGHDADARSDLFSFGCVFYEMLCGRRAFDGANGASVITSIMSGTAPPLTQSLPAVSPALERVIRTCLEKSPDDRWQTATDLRRELQWSAAGVQADVVAMKPARHSRLFWIGAAVAGFVLAFAGTLIPRKVKGELPLRLSIATPELGHITAFSISPDGRRIAFPLRKDGNVRLWVRHLEQETAQLLAGTEGSEPDEAPAWSPDGKQLAFVAGGMLKLIPSVGGPVRELTPARNRGLAWNANGVILFVNFAQTISRISPSGGQPEVVTKLDGKGAESSHRRPFFLPGGSHFLFHMTAQEGGVYAGSLDGAKPKLIVPQQRSNAEFVADPGSSSGWLLYVNGRTLLARRFDSGTLTLQGEPLTLSEHAGEVAGTRRAMFSSHADLIAYRAAEPMIERLVWYDRSGARLREVGEPRPFGIGVRLSPNGSQALVAISNSVDGSVPTFGGHIESVDLQSGAFTRRTFEQDTNSFSHAAFWSADGKTVYFGRGTRQTFQILRSPSDWSSSPQVIREYKSSTTAWDWNPESKVLLTYDTGLGNMAALTQTSSGWESRPLLEQERGAAKGKFSPDGRWLAYQGSLAVSGIFVASYPPTGAKWQISTDGFEPVWGPNGKELYYYRGDEIMVVDLDTTGRALSVGTPRTLFRAPLMRTSFLEGHRFDVTADGKRFLVIERVEEPPGLPFSVLVNWKSLLILK